jgi:hypothetical protein
MASWPQLRAFLFADHQPFWAFDLAFAGGALGGFSGACHP